MARLDGYDAVKAVAITLVVFGHVWNGLHDADLIRDQALFAGVEQAIYLFHMPVFFILSGLFFSAAQPPLAFLKARAVMLLWPLVLWSWVEGFAKFAAGESGNDASIGVMDALLFPFPPKSVFWFFWALFVLMALAYPVMRLPPPARVAVLLAASAAAVLDWIEVGFMPSLWPVVENLPFFAGGIVLASLGRRGLLLERAMLLPGLALFGVGQALLSAGFVPGHPVLTAAAIAASSLGFIAVVANLPGAGALAPLGRLTLPIYLSHILFTAAARIMLEKAGVTDVVAHVLFGTLLGMLGPLALYVVLRALRLTRAAGFGS